MTSGEARTVQPTVGPVPPAHLDLWRTGEAAEPADGLRQPRDRVSLSPQARERSAAGEPLDAAEQAGVRRLQEADQRVRAHERAHQAAGGGAAGAASYSYTLGPDGKMYATSGEVPIRVEGGRTPDETIAAAARLRAAALAPSDPSAQDLAVAAQAARMEARARAEKSRESSGEGPGPEAAPGTAPAEEARSRQVTAYEQAVANRFGPDATPFAAET